jgi:hypothetical protein
LRVPIVVTVSVEVVPLDVGVTGFLLKLPMAPLGSPLTERFTDTLYPLRAVSVTVYFVLVPALTVSDRGLAEMEKSGAGPVRVVKF